jgi:tripartite motif-containing protein 71
MPLKHFKANKREYLIFSFIALLVAFLAWKLFFARADTNPVFLRDYTYAPHSSSTPIAFNGAAWGITSDGAGGVYVATNVGGSVAHLDADGNLIYQVGRFGYSTSTPQAIYADGVARDVSGNVYLGSYSFFSPSYILKFDQSGNYLYSFPAVAIALTVDPSGNIFTIGTGATIQKYDQSGNVLATITPSQPLGNGHNYSMTSDEEGVLYVTDYSNSKIKKIDSATGTVLLSFGSSGTSTGQFNELGAVAVDGSGNIYVSDNATIGNQLQGRIQKFDSDGNFITQFLTPGTGNLTGLTIDTSNNIWAVDTISGEVFKFDPAGTLVFKVRGTTGALINESGSTFHPWHSVQDSQSNLYVLDDVYGGIFKFNSNGNYITRFGGYGSDPNEFGWPNGLAIDEDDNLYVSDCGSSVKKLSNDGTYLSSFGTPGTGDGQFSCPESLARDSQGNFYVFDENYPTTSRIQKFDADGNFLLQFGSRGSSTGQFIYLSDMVVSPDDDYLYVTDVNNHRVEKFDADGNYVTSWGSFGTSTGQFFYLQGLAVDSQGKVYAADGYTGEIQIFDSNGNYLSNFVNTSNIPFSDIFGLYIKNNTLFVSDYHGGRVTEFSLSQPPLVLSSIVAASSATSTSISFTTDGEGTTEVSFGPTASYGSSTFSGTTATSHQVTLTGLATCALYHYRVASSNGSATTTSSDATFTTDSCTAMASTTATVATTASSTATSSLTLSTIEVTVPPTFSTTTSATTTFQALKLDPVAFFASTTVPAGTRAASADVFHLNALTSATTTLTSFTAPITVTLRYDRNMLVGINEATLKIYRYDEGDWHVLSNCTRDPSAQSVTCETSHFSDFTILGAPDTSSVTLGASGYSIPPTGELSITPPAAGTGYQAPTPAPDLPAPAPTPVKAEPKATVPKTTAPKQAPKPAPATTTPRIPLTLPPQAPPHILKASTTLATTTPPSFRPPVQAAVPVQAVPAPKKAGWWERVKKYLGF